MALTWCEKNVAVDNARENNPCDTEWYNKWQREGSGFGKMTCLFFLILLGPILIALYLDFKLYYCTTLKVCDVCIELNSKAFQ